MQFNVSFDTANSPSLAALTAGEQQALLATMNAAANIWSWYLTAANITLDLQIVIDDSLYSGNVLAQGGPSDFYSTGTTQGGKNVYDADTAIKLRTGTDRNGSDADLRVYLTSNAIRNLMYFKTDDYASVPSNRVDALSVFLHEIAHGLGVISVSGDTSFPGITTFDTFIQGGKFTGTNAENAYRQLTGVLTGVPLEPGSLDHLAESGATRTDDLSPAMEGGVNAHLSALDLGLMQDIGIAIASRPAATTASTLLPASRWTWAAATMPAMRWAVGRSSMAASATIRCLANGVTTTCMAMPATTT